ncbi:hypothetical protein LguiB_029063 [Lonicera macranthoides]
MKTRMMRELAKAHLLIYCCCWCVITFAFLVHSTAALDGDQPSPPVLSDSLAQAMTIILIATIGPIVIMLIFKYCLNKRSKYSKIKENNNNGLWTGLYKFSKAEIEIAINYHNEEKSTSSAGRVNMGILPNGQVVAIEEICKSSSRYRPSVSFEREIQRLSFIRHPNLVSFFGYCTSQDQELQYIVYEHCAAGNLAQHLIRKDNVLCWERRVMILRDCARAIRYLHFHTDGCIIHGDINLTSIRLNEKFEPKLSDFGLAKVSGMEERLFAVNEGTAGYIDPEYISDGVLSSASDVYSFGMVALQLLSGQKVLQLDLEARHELTRKAKAVSMGKRPLTDFEDPALNGKCNTADFESILEVAVFCVASSRIGRPTIDVVFETMDKAWKNAVAYVHESSETAEFNGELRIQTT